MKSSVSAGATPILELTLDAGETIVAESSEVAGLTPGFDITTSTRLLAQGGGGFLHGVKRVLGGGRMFLTQYAATENRQLIALTTRLPGTVEEVQLDGDCAYLVETGAYMASTTGVEATVGLQRKLGAGLIGGAGVLFQRLGGHGTAWLQIAGQLQRYELAEYEAMLVHPGHLGMFEQGMQIDFTSIKGVKNKLFGDSLFMARIHGPGHLWLQSMTVAKLAAAIQPYLDLDRSPSFSIDRT